MSITLSYPGSLAIAVKEHYSIENEQQKQRSCSHTCSPMSVQIPAFYQIGPVIQSMLSQVTSTNAEIGSSPVYTQSDEAGFSGRQNLLAGVHQSKVESHESDSVYADEAALPSFAQMAAVQGPQLAGWPQLWSGKQPRLQSRAQVNGCSLLSGRCVCLFNSVLQTGSACF